MTTKRIIVPTVIATSSPTSTDDRSKGLYIGFRWLNGTSEYVCTDDAVGSAVWTAVGGGSGGAVNSVTADEVTLHADNSDPVNPVLNILNDGVDTAQIKNAAVTKAKIENVTTSHLLGRGDSSTGAPQEITLGSGLSMTGTTLSASGASGVSSVNTRTGAVTLVATDIPTMVASGASHAGGAVPDTPSTSGTTKFLREDGTWAVPPGGSGGGSDVSVIGTLSCDISGGVISNIVATGIVDTISRTATGLFDISFLAAEADTHYIVTGAVPDDGIDSRQFGLQGGAANYTTTGFKIAVVRIGTDGLQDPSFLRIAILRQGVAAPTIDPYSPIRLDAFGNTFVGGAGDNRVGMRIQFTKSGKVVTGTRIYWGSSSAGSVTCKLYDESGTVVASNASGFAIASSSPGIYEISFDTPYTVVDADLGKFFTITSYDSSHFNSFSNTRAMPSFSPNGFFWRAEPRYASGDAFPTTVPSSDTMYPAEPII